jgi:hypothetical protein
MPAMTQMTAMHDIPTSPNTNAKPLTYITPIKIVVLNSKVVYFVPAHAAANTQPMPVCCSITAVHIIYISHQPACAMHLKRVVLWRNLDVEVVSQYGDLLHNVLAHTRYLGEEEEGEEAGCATESGGEDATVMKVRLWSGVEEGREGGRTLSWQTLR